MPTDLQPFLSLISSGGTLTILIVAIWAGYTRRIVFGWVYDEKVREAEEWRTIALRGINTAGTAVSALEITAKKGTPA